MPYENINIISLIMDELLLVSSNVNITIIIPITDKTAKLVDSIFATPCKALSFSVLLLNPLICI